MNNPRAIGTHCSIRCGGRGPFVNGVPVDSGDHSDQCFVMKTYMCLICGYLFDEEEGDPESGIPAGTRWEDVPLSWRCPDCGAGKEDFEMVEV